MVVPGVKTLVYAPGARVLFSTKHGMIDASKDITNLQVARKVNSISSMAVALNNKSGRYTGLLDTNDRVVVFMRRLDKWIQVFSGYLDSVPVFALYPTIANITASCTLKRLKYTYWDPGLPASKDLFVQNPDQGTDSGAGDLLGRLLTKVGQWDETKIQIQKLPEALIDVIASGENALPGDEQYEKTREKVKNILGFSGYSGGNSAVGAVTGGSVPAPANGSSYNFNELAAIAIMAGFPNSSVPTAIAVAMAESSGNPSASNTNTNGSTDRGLWQINSVHKQYDATQLNDPLYNAKAALEISGGGTNWNPWVTFKKGMHTKFMQQAAAGAAAPTQFPTSADPGASVGGSGGYAYPCPAAKTSSGYGPRGGGFHYGTDMAAPLGTAIYAAADGTITKAGPSTGFGNAVVITMADGTELWNGHMKGPGVGIMVSVGQTVKAGQQIAVVGSEGQSTGPHLHFEIRPSREDPIKWLAARGVGPGNAGGVATTGAAPGGGGAGVPTITSATTEAEMKAIFGASAEEVKSKLVSIQFQENTIQVHQLAQQAFQNVDSAITAAGGNTYKIKLVGTFNWRAKQGNAAAGSGLSNHSFGIAIDINPQQNPYQKPLTTDIPPSWVNAFKSNNFQWGGDWETPDAMHFEWMGGSNPANAADGSGDTQKLADAVFNLLFPMPGEPDPTSEELLGNLAPMNDQPLWPSVLEAAKAGMRSVMSAPDGQFVAFYPDYFGVFNKDAKIKIEDIEIKDLSVSKSDDAFASHVYGLGNTNSNGEVGRWGSAAEYLLGGQGVVSTVFDKTMMRALLGIDPDQDPDFDGKVLIQKYGVRPLVKDFSLIKAPAYEYFFTLQSFMEQWAKMYSTPVSITFMPEIYPGMRVEATSQKVTVFVEGVTHTYSPESGANTQLSVTAPSALDGGIKGLPRDMSQVGLA